MAHELTIRTDGKVEMAYLDGVARWHGLGNELAANASIEEWCEAAGLDWSAQRAMVRYAIGRGEGAENWLTYGDKDDGKVVIFRSDTKAPLGIVSTSYQIVQPAEVLEFWRDLVGAGGMELQTAGTLFGGRKIWALAKVCEAAVIDPRNIVRENLLLATSLDGSMATEAFYCDTVVVCNNTLRAAEGETKVKVKVNHRSKFEANAVKNELGIESAISNFQRAMRDMRELAEKRMKPTDVILNTCELLKPGFAELSDKERKRVENSKPVQTIGKLALDHEAIGSEYDGMNGTAWGWLNSVTEYVDHGARAFNADNRMDSAFFGKGAAMKERAREMATLYAPSLDDVIAATPVAAMPGGLLDAIVAQTQGDIL